MLFPSQRKGKENKGKERERKKRIVKEKEIKERKGKETKRRDGLKKSTQWTWDEMSWLAGIRSEVNRVRQK